MLPAEAKTIGVKNVREGITGDFYKDSYRLIDDVNYQVRNSQ